MLLKLGNRSTLNAKKQNDPLSLNFLALGLLPVVRKDLSIFLNFLLFIPDLCLRSVSGKSFASLRSVG